MSSDLAPPATTRFAPPPSSRTSRPMTRRIFINRRRSLLARRGPGPTGPRAAGQAPSGGIETAVAAFGRRWAKIGGRARRSSWLPRILGECFLHVAGRIRAEGVRPPGAFPIHKEQETDGADKGNGKRSGRGKGGKKGKD